MGETTVRLCQWERPPTKEAKQMEYKITATLQQDLEIIIEADSLEEAQRIADDEMITDDFDVIGAVFNFVNIVEIEKK
jgi:hypothetical protein